MLRCVSTITLLLMLFGLLPTGGCAPTGIYHTVQPGQTLYRISRTYGIEEQRLAQINGIRDPSQLKANQRLFIPGARHVMKVPATVANEPAKAATRTRTPAVSPTRPTVKSSKALPKTPVQAAVRPGKGVFIWPAKGRLLNKFGSQGQKVYKGIEIGIPKGTAVVAAASGKVIYSGNAIPGYGNLVILEHSDNFFSVYGYNEKNLVKMDDFVGQGEKIALSGLPPSGQSARLHFEIRQGKSAVDPILYLP
jgi:murein DD-endopeptidase MepM/ murein hydrolase activator NlpD